jgi:plasmid stabilization system protein ParE
MIVELLPIAQEELERARDRYEAEREGLGAEFVDEMELLIAEIAEGPLHFQRYPRTRFRRALGTRFPYMMVFLVVEDGVRVICVAHQHRKPRYRQGRS